MLELVSFLSQFTYCRTALYYHSLGFSVIPVHPDRKLPLVPWKPYIVRAPTEEEIRSWWAENPNARPGIVIPLAKGIAALEGIGGESEGG